MVAVIKAHKYYYPTKHYIRTDYEPSGKLRTFLFSPCIAVDAGLALLILFSVALISEWIIRHRERRKI